MHVASGRLRERGQSSGDSEQLGSGGRSDDRTEVGRQDVHPRLDVREDLGDTKAKADSVLARDLGTTRVGRADLVPRLLELLRRFTSPLDPAPLLLA